MSNNIEGYIMRKPSRKGKANKIKVDYTLRDVYKLYYKKNVEADLQLPYKQYSELCKEFNQLAMNAIVMESESLTMGRLGTLRIAKRKMEVAKNRLKVDWASTKKHGKIIYHLNEHSNGYRYRWLWSKGNVPNRTLYSFTAVRNQKRQINKAVRIYKKDYFI